MIIDFIKRHKVLTGIAVIILLIIVYNAQSLFINFSPLSQTTGGRLMQNKVSSPSLGLGGDDFGLSEEASLDSYAPPSTAADIPGETRQDAKIIKTASLIMEVREVKQAVEGIANIAKKVGGFVLNSSVSENKEGVKRADIIVKVPVSTFDNSVKEIKTLAVFIASENITGQDVTEEFIDLEAQVKNLRAEEEQYLEILKRAFTIEDTLKVTSKLSIVRGNIERIEGKIKYLEGQTDFSTISVSLNEEGEVTIPSTKWRPLSVIKQSAINMVHRLQGFVDNIIKFVFWLLGIIPYLIVLAIIYWLIKRRQKHHPPTS